MTYLVILLIIYVLFNEARTVVIIERIKTDEERIKRNEK